MKKIALVAFIAFTAMLGGCVHDQNGNINFSATLAQFDSSVTKYAPIVGKDLILVANIIVQAECSPAMTPTSQAAVNVLNIVAPDSKSAKTVTSALNKNAQVAAQICPLYASIKATVGAVPAATTPPTVVSGGA